MPYRLTNGQPYQLKHARAFAKSFGKPFHVLTSDNTTFDMNTVDHEIDDIRYSVLDYHKSDTDFYFLPLLYAEAYEQPAAVLQIANHHITVPLSWSIIIADKHSGDMELIEIKDIRDRAFDAFVMNPITCYRPEFEPLTHVDTYADVFWTIPTMKATHVLGIPLTQCHNPPCVWMTFKRGKELDELDISQIVI